MRMFVLTRDDHGIVVDYESNDGKHFDRLTTWNSPIPDELRAIVVPPRVSYFKFSSRHTSLGSAENSRANVNTRLVRWQYDRCHSSTYARPSTLHPVPIIHRAHSTSRSQRAQGDTCYGANTTQTVYVAQSASVPRRDG